MAVYTEEKLKEVIGSVTGAGQGGHGGCAKRGRQSLQSHRAVLESWRISRCSLRVLRAR